MIIKSKTGEELNFLESGVDGIYVLDHVAFKDQFDEDGKNDWEKSTGKKKLQEWAEKNLPKEILEQFGVDLPTIEEVFSQKMFNLYKSSKKLKSKQFPIFQNSDNRMMEFEGKPEFWLTRSACAGYDYAVMVVSCGGNLDSNGAYFALGFVPILRKR